MRRALLLTGTGLAGALALRHRNRLDVVPASLPAEQVDVSLDDRSVVASYRRGPVAERPVLLIHSVNAAASAAEMRPLFDRLASSRRVVAIDLPGYGRSSRPPGRYDPHTMTEGVLAVLGDLGEPADLVALSLGCELAARAALDRPDLVRTLTLISPTGLQTRQRRPNPSTWLGALLRAPIVGEAIYGMLASGPSIDYFLAKSFEGDVDVDLANHARLAARHRNARFAPASFLEGALFTSDAVETLYRRLALPVLVIADQDAYTDFGALASLLPGRPNWRHERMAPNRGMPHFEHPEAVARSITTFQEGS